jgi:Cu(I)/Ag(I) efflux system membrane protein CusA/SilA
MPCPRPRDSAGLAYPASLSLLGVAALVALAVYALREIHLDALPDLSDAQVIIYSRWDRSPDILEDQVT